MDHQVLQSYSFPIASIFQSIQAGLNGTLLNTSQASALSATAEHLVTNIYSLNCTARMHLQSCIHICLAYDLTVTSAPPVSVTSANDAQEIKIHKYTGNQDAQVHRDKGI